MNDQKIISPPSGPLEDTPRTSIIDNMADPSDAGIDAVWEEEWKRNLMEFATRRVKSRVDPKHYQIFHLYVMKQYPVAKLCAMFDVPAGQVYVIKSRISNLIKQEVEKLESQPEGQV